MRRFRRSVERHARAVQGRIPGLLSGNQPPGPRGLRGVAPDCEWHSELSELVGEPGSWVGGEQITRFFEEFFELIPDWHVGSVRVLQAADDVFVTLDRGRGSGRGSGAPIEVDLASVIELRDGLPARVHQYSSWEQGLLAAGLDPSIAADVRRPERQTTS